MLEIASGKDWETLMQEEIFTPMRMKTATLGIVYDDALPPKAPVGHDLASGQTVPVPRAAMSSAALFRYQASNGAGGYVACTLQDWVKFLHMHATSDISDYLTAATASRLQQPFTGTEGYGRGIYAVNRSWATPGQALNHAGDI
jgi:CubicO group peptidase (beta-lactamase class C family)